MADIKINNFQMKIQNLNFLVGSELTSYWGITIRTLELSRNVMVFSPNHYLITILSENLDSYYHLPTSTQSTQRISTPVLYRGLLYGRIFYMWWLDWTNEHVYRSGPLTLSWFLSLTMYPRHCKYCAV